ncbi:MAG: hypothetical protein JWM59_3167 [Verrucomicrobiales bacterium]|nr:hypothetical protein [Verrucomicrobiales bacterium]
MGMLLPISTLTVTRFRSLRGLTAGPFGRVNLITGKNNTGKSTLLEAIRVLVTDGAPGTLFSILNYREELTASDREAPITPLDSPWFSSLFSDFPDLTGCGEPFTVSSAAGDSMPLKTVEIKVGWYSEQVDDETGNHRFIPVTGTDPPDENEAVPFLEIKAPHRQRRIRLDSLRSMAGRRVVEGMGTEGLRMPCLYLDPFSGRSPSHLGVLWDAIALTSRERQVVEALRIISPDIEAVSMIGSGNGNRFRTAIAKSRQFRAPVSLRTFGDGVNRLFGIILSLVNAAGGVLLVDEIENGLHHSILPDVWKIIFQMADELNVQIFATSHSWDCVDSFQQAANVHPQTGVLARLTSLNGKIIPTLFSENELRIAARDQIEVR